jgi:hypothetical protein
VGINEDTPTKQLHITHASWANMALEGSDTGGGYIDFMAGSSEFRGRILMDNESATTTDGKMQFFTGGNDSNDRMTIDSSGHIGMNTTTSPDTQLFVKGSAASMSYGILRVQTPGTSSACDAIMFQDGDGDICGKMVVNMSTNVLSITYSSDYRLKENVIPMDNGITKIKALKPKYFNYIKDPDKTVLGGFLAHEVSDIVPEAIFGEKDAMKTEKYEVTPAVEEVMDADGNITTEAVEAVMGEREVMDEQSIDTSKLIPTIIGALQEAITRIETLENA